MGRLTQRYMREKWLLTYFIEYIINTIVYFDGNSLVRYLIVDNRFQYCKVCFARNETLSINKTQDRNGEETSINRIL